MRPAIIQFIDERPELHHLELSRDEWTLLDHTLQFLLPFKEACKDCEKDNITLEHLQTSIDILVKHFEQSRAKHANNPLFLQSIGTAWYVFDKYYLKVDESPLPTAAILLHPSQRKQYMLDYWKPSWINPGVLRARRLWQAHYQCGYLRNSLERYRPAPPAAASSSECTGQEPSFYQLQHKIRKRQKTAISDEFEHFIKQTPVAVDNPIKWWLEPEQQSTYPRLSIMAIDVLSSPLMSAEAERVFLMARRTISWDRTLLNADTVEATELQKSWQQNGFLDDSDYGSSSDEDGDYMMSGGGGDGSEVATPATATPINSFISSVYLDSD